LAGVARGSVYSFDAGDHTHMSGSSGSFFDHSSGSHFSKTYDFGRGAHWNISLNGNRFSGYDHGFGDHFSGMINGQNVSIYDHGTGSHYNFTA